MAPPMVYALDKRPETSQPQERIHIRNGNKGDDLAPLKLPGEIYVDGEPYPPEFNPDNIRSAKQILPRPSDIFICTYPKCGTTWIQHIVLQLMDRTEYESATDEFKMDSSDKHMCFVSPMIEFMGKEYVDNIPAPRILKSHFTFDSIPKGGGAKYIYAVRNPKDCLTSYFHHTRNFKMYDFEHGLFDVYFELFMSGQVGFGDYFQHFQSWLGGIEEQKENILFLTYEEMVEDLRGSVVKIANFLGGSAARLVENEDILDQIIDKSMLKSMKNDQHRWFPSCFLNQTNFIRKGGSRDWKKHFSLEQSRRMDEKFNKKMSSTKAKDWWKVEMTWDDDELNMKEN